MGMEFGFLDRLGQRIELVEHVVGVVYSEEVVVVVGVVEPVESELVAGSVVVAVVAAGSSAVVVELVVVLVSELVVHPRLRFDECSRIGRTVVGC